MRDKRKSRYVELCQSEIDACKARLLIPNSRFRRVAARMAKCHPRALDYIKQAPVLVVAVAAERGEDRTQATLGKCVEKFRERVSRGPRLKELMESYGLRYPLRKIDPKTLTPNTAVLIQIISNLTELSSTTLSQSIPESLEDQNRWLSFVWAFRTQVLGQATLNFGISNREAVNELIHKKLSWVVEACGQLISRKIPGQILPDSTIIPDFMAANEDSFDYRWTLVRATRAAVEWHRELARRNPDRFIRRVETDYFNLDDRGLPIPADYGVLPLGLILGEYLFEALDDPNLLFEEGAVMHHCVASYGRYVYGGTSFIYSVSKNGERVATLELRRQSAYEVLYGARKPRELKFQIWQIKGPKNTRPNTKVLEVADKFLEIANKLRPDKTEEKTITAKEIVSQITTAAGELIGYTSPALWDWR